MIYEDVQRDSRPAEANNGWSSSEFESYDEQSDNEAKLPAKSKVRPGRSKQFVSEGVVTDQVVLVAFQHLKQNQGEYLIFRFSCVVMFINVKKWKKL